MASVRRFEDALRQGSVGVLAPAAEEDTAARACGRVLACLRPAPGETLLDLGCLAGAMLRCASSLPLEVTGLEFSPEAAAMAQKCAPEAEVFIGSLNELPFESSAFQYVTCLEGPADPYDPCLDLSEVYRVLKPGGRACLVLSQEEPAGPEDEYLVIPPSPPLARTFSGWLTELSDAGLHLLDAWPEAYLWRTRGLPRFLSSAWGQAWKRRLWAWLPAWRQQPVVFLVEKPCLFSS